MRFPVILFLFSLSLHTSTAQDTFIKVYGEYSFDVGRSIVQTEDGGYMIAGSTGSYGLSHGHFQLFLTDEWGNVQWRKFYGGEFSSFLNSMAQTQDGGYILVGITETLDMSYQILAVKTDADGEEQWRRVLGGELWDIANKVIALPDGGYAVAGQTFSQGAGQGDAYLIRLNADGDTLWTRTYGGEGNDAANSIAATADNGLILCGRTESFGAGMYDIYLVKTDAQGDTIWTRTIGGEEDEVAHAVLEAQDGGYVMAGSKTTGSAGGADFYIHKVNSSGVDMWSDFVGGPNDDEWLDIIELPSSELVVVGYSQTTTSGGGGEDIFMKRIYHNSYFAGMQRTYGGGGDERGYSVVRTADNGYAIVGETDGYLERQRDVMLVKTDTEGFHNPVISSISELQDNGETFMIAVAPNPFNGSTSLIADGFDRWGASSGETVLVEVFCPLGRLALNKKVTSSVTEIDMHGFPQGIYAYRLTAGPRLIASGRLVNTGH